MKPMKRRKRKRKRRKRKRNKNKTKTQQKNSYIIKRFYMNYYGKNLKT
jgi:hypothetical protein